MTRIRSLRGFWPRSTLPTRNRLAGWSVASTRYAEDVSCGEPVRRAPHSCATALRAHPFLFLLRLGGSCFERNDVEFHHLHHGAHGGGVFEQLGKIRRQNPPAGAH